MIAHRRVAIEIAAPAWRAAVPQCRQLVLRCARAALASAPAAPGALAVLLTDDAALRELNRSFRAQDKPTNVLSFPGGGDAGAPLGDVAVAFGVARREAHAAGRPLADHLAHLVVHGVLHLLGHDHGRPDEAMRMERLEARLLAHLGIVNPYGARARRAA
jgi:probable rRNA maturation factor